MGAKKKYDERRMPFLGHLEELRWHIFRMIASVFGLSIIAYFFAEQLVDFFTSPYPGKLVYLGPADAFMVQLKLSFFVGIIASLPVILREFWAFIAPGLLEQERKYIPLIVGLTFLCFLAGASFCFFIVLPLTIKFLSSFQTAKLVQNVTIDKYLDFITNMLLGFGLVFEMPMLSMLLTRIGIITPDLMKKYRSYAVVGIFIVAAVITPSTDATTQLALAVPMMGLYEISIYIAKVVQRKKKEREEKEEAEYEEELRQEKERKSKARQDASAQETKPAGESEVKKWETEGDHYTTPETKPVQPDAPIYDDLYPYSESPKSTGTQNEDSSPTVNYNPDDPSLERNPETGNVKPEEGSTGQENSESSSDQNNEEKPDKSDNPDDPIDKVI